MLIYAAVMQVLKQLHRQMVPSRLAGSPVACNICRYEIKPPAAR